MIIGFVSWAIIANFWLIPWLKDNPFHKGLALLTIPHVFRYIGLSFLITGVTTSPLDPRFAVPAAYGDLIAAVLALIAVMALLIRLVNTSLSSDALPDVGGRVENSF